jgi:hypothetical protein
MISPKTKRATVQNISKKRLISKTVSTICGVYCAYFGAYFGAY